MAAFSSPIANDFFSSRSFMSFGFGFDHFAKEVRICLVRRLSISIIFMMAKLMIFNVT